MFVESAEYRIFSHRLTFREMPIPSARLSWPIPPALPRNDFHSSPPSHLIFTLLYFFKKPSWLFASGLTYSLPSVVPVHRVHSTFRGHENIFISFNIRKEVNVISLDYSHLYTIIYIYHIICVCVSLTLPLGEGERGRRKADGGSCLWRQKCRGPTKSAQPLLLPHISLVIPNPSFKTQLSSQQLQLRLLWTRREKARET